MGKKMNSGRTMNKKKSARYLNHNSRGTPTKWFGKRDHVKKFLLKNKKGKEKKSSRRWGYRGSQEERHKLEDFVGC